MTVEEQRFIDDLGDLMVSWGLPRSTGRVYGLLLARGEPMSLDAIADILGSAKSGASVAARQLVSLGIARVSGERGSRRVRYEALYTLEAIFAARSAQVGQLLHHLRNGASVAESANTRARLEEMADGVQLWMEAVQQAIDGSAHHQRRKG